MSNSLHEANLWECLNMIKMCDKPLLCGSFDYSRYDTQAGPYFVPRPTRSCQKLAWVDILSTNNRSTYNNGRITEYETLIFYKNSYELKSCIKVGWHLFSAFQIMNTQHWNMLQVKLFSLLLLRFWSEFEAKVKIQEKFKSFVNSACFKPRLGWYCQDIWIE